MRRFSTRGRVRWPVLLLAAGLLVFTCGAVFGRWMGELPAAAQVAPREEPPVWLPYPAPVLPVAAVHTEDNGLVPRRFGPQVVAAVWEDGRIIWSEDDLRGGPPYREARLPPERVTAFLAALERGGAFAHPARWESYLISDGLHTAIAVAAGRRRLQIASYHELMPGAGGAEVGTEAHRRFLRLWEELRAEFRRLVPDEGERVGELEFHLRQAPPP